MYCIVDANATNGLKTTTLFREHWSIFSATFAFPRGFSDPFLLLFAHASTLNAYGDEPLARTPTFFAFSLSSSPLLEPSLPFAQRLLARPGLSLSRSRHAFRTGHSRALHTSRTRPRLHATSRPDPSRAIRTFASTITLCHRAFAPPRTVSGPTKTRFRRWHGRRTSPVGYHAFVSLSARGSR